MIELIKDNFDAETSTGTVLVDFWGESCGRCKELMPDVHRLAEQYGDKIKFCSVNTSTQGNRRVAMSQKVMGLPAFVFYKDGERGEHLSGEELDAAQLEAAIKAHI